ncbi:MAG TPA: transglutaminase domain-containing protein [Verrucomicrobiae bacterium]|jgi:hypothetical protein
MLEPLLRRPSWSLTGNRGASPSFLLRYYRLFAALFSMGTQPAFTLPKLPMKAGEFGRWKKFLAAPLGIFLMAHCAIATTLSNLLNQKDLTPTALAQVIANFSFELAPQVQEPDTFLQRKRGDCADFANLASIVLTNHGYNAKLVVVMMSQQTHVVCYIKEAGGFLDYNHRADAQPVVPSDGSLEDIAQKVAGDFHSDWRMASAFRYSKGNPIYGQLVFAEETSIKKENKQTKKISSAATPLAVQAVIN